MLGSKEVVVTGGIQDFYAWSQWTATITQKKHFKTDG